MNRKIKKIIISLSIITVASSNAIGLIPLPFTASNNIVHADTRYTIMSKTLSAQQTRDWAKATRVAGGVGKASAAALSYLAKVTGNPALAAGATLAGFCKPAYFATIQKSSRPRKKVKTCHHRFKNPTYFILSPI